MSRCRRVPFGQGLEVRVMGEEENMLVNIRDERVEWNSFVTIITESTPPISSTILGRGGGRGTTDGGKGELAHCTRVSERGLETDAKPYTNLFQHANKHLYDELRSQLRFAPHFAPLRPPLAPPPPPHLLTNIPFSIVYLALSSNNTLSSSKPSLTARDFMCAASVTPTLAVSPPVMISQQEGFDL